ncbi:MBL fold metallo-hydrolase [Streptomyces sp. NPDC048295]|uniref:MBL fold metallo-hydrolase n=1 Tax=Streptomyces sp. NPDC048295 TaxID=3154617 RepID=UPI0034216CA5
MASHLRYDVLVTPGAERAGKVLPNGDPITSSPVSTVLVHGEEEAVLVDPPFLDSQIEQVRAWIASSGKRVRYVFATHGHGDHWFGTDSLLRDFPNARVYATPGTIEVMHQQATEGRAAMWDVDFPGQVPPSPVVAEPVPAEGFRLEGELLQSIEVGHTDTDQTSVLHVPSLGLVVAGDCVYNGVHQYFLEGGNGGLEAWLGALDVIEGLKPRFVVAGHKNAALPDDPATIASTREYLLDVIRLLEEKPKASEFYEELLRLHPDRLNPGPVWYGAVGLLGA